ncbi:hypothetical protein ZIOFF_034068 [Zingiber officinale]|uniref:Retrovirus-related Pol polyprotein from transposon TNT 1-94-like beta-barrel domain-containing protein n=1 Tax=Zingiber officinale TaxID=94328 RepID=A0A8J5L7B1_ZINOF|nr:hypothetical protein ZIOFF_034068 [Zingiber officinale]
MSEHSSEFTTIPQSSSHPAQITTIKLNGDNFLRWSQSVKMYIRGRGMISYLTGEKKTPSEKDPMHATWDAENFMVMTWLVNSMEEEIDANYMCFPTAYELWENINQMYSDLGNQSQIFELTLKLGELRQGEEPVTKYFNSLKSIWQDLDFFDAYEWKNIEDEQYHKKTVEDSRIFKFLAGLNVEFDEVRGRIIGRRPLPSLGEVFSKVRREESQRNVMLGKKGPTTIIKGSALTSTGSNIRKDTANLRKPKEKSVLWCNFCNKPRHTRETCWKIHGKPKNFKGKSGEKNGRIFPTVNEAMTIANTITKEHLEQLLALLTSNPSSSTPNVSMAHTGNEIIVFPCGFGISAPWIIDSGASDHMTNSLKLLKLYSPCPENKKVKIADGSFSPIAGKGSVQISENIDLKFVLYVPKLTCNLLSDRSSGKMISSAKMVNGLYYFEGILPSKEIVQGLSSISSLSVYDQIMVWHCRLVMCGDPQRRNVLGRSRDELTIPAQASLEAPGKGTLNTPGNEVSGLVLEDWRGIGADRSIHGGIHDPHWFLGGNRVASLFLSSLFSPSTRGSSCTIGNHGIGLGWIGSRGVKLLKTDDKVTVLESEKRAWESTPEAQAIRDALNPWRERDDAARKSS